MADLPSENLNPATGANVQCMDGMLAFSPAAGLGQVCAGDSYFGAIEWVAFQVIATDNGAGGNTWSIVTASPQKATPRITSAGTTLSLNMTGFHAVGSVIVNVPPAWLGMFRAGPSVTVGNISIVINSGLSLNTPALRGAPITVLAAMVPEIR